MNAGSLKDDPLIVQDVYVLSKERFSLTFRILFDIILSLHSDLTFQNPRIRN